MNMFKKNGGFTLVELIVVIAILAILAGVAVPAYSGYLKKAESAADTQLLGAINTAFASACLQNGYSQYDVANAVIRIDADGKIVTTPVTRSAVTATFFVNVNYKNGVTGDAAKLNASFAAFYAGNETSAFNGIKSRNLVLDPAKGVFVDPQNVETLTVTYGGNEITVSGAAISAMVNSTFGGTIGGKGLLMEVAGLTNMVETGDIDADALLADEDYMRSFASYLGIEGIDELTYVVGGGGTLNAAIDAAMEEALLKSGLTDPAEIEAAAAGAMINGFVYYAAEGTKEMTTEDVTSFLTSGNIAANLSTNQSTKLAQASMAYGMYTAFVNSEYNTVGATTSTNDPMGAIGVISGQNAETSAAFDKYIKSDEGKADIEAYMAAMDVINNSTGNDVTADVLLKGFDDAELGELLVQVLGK